MTTVREKLKHAAEAVLDARTPTPREIGSVANTAQKAVRHGIGVGLVKLAVLIHPTPSDEQHDKPSE